MARPGRLWKILTLTLAALLALAMGVGVWVVSLRDRRWAEMENRVRELRVGLNAPPLERIPLGRAPISGNAWDDYLLPMSDKDLFLAETGLNHLLYGADDGGEVKPVIERNGACLELIRRAARRERCKPPPARTDDGFTLIGDDSFPALRTGINLSLAQAHLLARGGRPQEALELALDAYLCARDLAGTRIGRCGGRGLPLMEEALDEMSDILKLGALDPTLLLELERRFDLLSRYPPDDAPMLLDNLMEMGEMLLHPSYQKSWLEEPDSDYARERWRYFFSIHLQAATYFARADHLVQQVIGFEKLSWAEAGPRFRLIDKEADARMLLRAALRNLGYIRTSRRIRTQLRMNTIAAHYRATGELKADDSEFAGKIRTRLTKESLLIWVPAEDDGDGVPPAEDFKGHGVVQMRFAVPARP